MPPKRREPVIGPGFRIDRYVVVSELGEGGMGAVYLANDPVLNRSVAVKLLHAHGRPEDSAAAKARLEREAQALARISHPNTVAVYDVGAIGDSIFLAMEHVEGVNLRHWVEQAPHHWTEIVSVFIQAARGLAAVHSAGLVHRDFKPGNVIVTRAGLAKVLDFGLARFDASAAHEEPVFTSEMLGFIASDAAPAPKNPLDTPLTQAGHVPGTAGFIAPELFRKEPASPASDQFAFGVSLYWALFGCRPFEGGDLYTYWQSLRAGPAQVPPGSRVPTWLSGIALRCVSREAKDRFPSMEAVIEALGKDPHRQRRIVGAAALAVIVLGAAVWAGIGFSARERCPTDSELKTSFWKNTSLQVMRTRLVAARPGFTPRIDRTLTQLEQATARWANQAQDSCMVLRESKPTAIDIQREACLQRQHQALTVLVDALAQADPSIVPSIDEIVESFLQGVGCESDRAVMRVGPDDVAPAQKELASKLRAQLFRARVLGNLKKLSQSFDEATAVAQAAHQAGLKGFESEARVLIGNVEVARGNTEAAMVAYQDAFVLGLRAGTDERAFYAGAVLIRQVREFRERIGEAKQVMAVVEALFERLGGDAHLEMELLSTRASIAEAEGKLNEAVELERRKLELAKNVAGPRSSTTAAAMDALSSRLRNNRKVTESNEVDAEKFQLLFELYGPDDPAVLYIIPPLAGGLRAEGRTGAGRELLETAHELAPRLLSPDDETVAVLKLELSESLAGVDEPRALVLAQEAVAFLEKGTSKGNLAEALSRQARALVAVGRAHEAMPLCERAGHLRENLTDAQGNHRRGTLICKAVVLQKSDPSRAAQLWSKALAVQPPALPGVQGMMCFGLAQALVHSGGSKAEAIRRATEAREAYSTFPDFADKVDEIDRWLKTVR